MSKAMDSLATINSFIRTMLALVIVGGVGGGGWYVYSTYVARKGENQRNLEQLVATRLKLDEATAEIERKAQEIATLEADVQAKAKEIERLDTAMRLLKVTHRVARLDVLEQGPDTDSGELHTVVEFTELSGEGRAIGSPKKFRIKGDMVYIDTWVVKFDEKYVETADIDRATSLVLFHRIFGEFQEPKDGYAIDDEGGQPLVYSRGGEPSEFERKIWSDFWNIANDPKKAEELGIRAAHGEAPSIKVLPGKSYRILLRAADGLSITPDGDAPPRGTST
ncbi:MAG: hypothetical protein FJ297_07100 [Planctomycetes bacterium]|nr:hypothetical protein [Planctomycetota bacterium]